MQNAHVPVNSVCGARPRTAQAKEKAPLFQEVLSLRKDRGQKMGCKMRVMGFEPMISKLKVLCLTSWLHPQRCAYFTVGGATFPFGKTTFSPMTLKPVYCARARKMWSVRKRFTNSALVLGVSANVNFVIELHLFLSVLD